MQRQQLFNSLWVSLTATVLATGPASANKIKVSAIRFNPTASGIDVVIETAKSGSPQVFTSRSGTTFIADLIDTQLQSRPGDSFRQYNPVDGIAEIAVKPLSANSIRVTVIGKAGLPQAKVVGSDRGVVFKLTPTGVGKPNRIAANSQSPNSLSRPIAVASALLTRTPATASVGQPAERVTLAQRRRTNGDRQQRPVPGYLNPNPNPLQFPTKTDEVRVRATQPVTLQQAVELARRNNRDLQVTELTLERSRAGLREAQAALYPTLNSTAGVGRQQGAGSQLTGARAAQTGLQSQADTPGTAATGSLTLSYDLFTAGERPARIRAAEEQVRFNELDVERQLEELRLNVSGDYFDLQRADEQVRINQSAVANSQANLRDTRALEAAGLRTRFEVLQAEVQLANARQDLTNAVSLQQNARRQLVRRLNLAQSVDLTAADPVQIRGLWQRSLEDSIVLAFRNRAELQQQLIQRNVSEQNRRIALSALKPKVSLSASYNLQNTFNDSLGFGDGYTLGANLTLSLFDAGAARARAAQEEANIAIAETRFADNRSLIRLQVEQAYANLQSNFENIQTARVAVEQAREASRLARLRFQAGVGTQTEVINSENELTRSEGNLVTAILNYNRSLTQIERAVSTGLPR